MWQRKNVLSSEQCTCSQSCNCNGKITLPTASPTTVFARFGSFRLFFVSEHKKQFTGKKFTTNEEVEWNTDTYFAELPKSYYLESIKKLEYCWPSVLSCKRTTLKTKVKFVRKNCFHCFCMAFSRPPLYI